MMTTRRGRKQVLKSKQQQQQQQEDQENDQQPTVEQNKNNNNHTAATISSTTANNSKSNIVRAFLETWLNVKREWDKAAGTEADMYDEISHRLIESGYAVSSKLVKHKIGNFVKKYHFVKKCELEGKKIEWVNYDIVKMIFELDGPQMQGIVVIPRQNIKSEDELDIIDDQDMTVDKHGADSAQTQTVQTVKEETFDCIEIPNESVFAQKRKQSDNEDDEESDVSDDLDEDLDFDNPLDKIPLKLPNGTTVELERPKSGTMEPPNKKTKPDPIITMPQLRTVPSTLAKKPVTLTTQPRTLPGLNKDEFLIPTMNSTTGQQQFLVVKRLEGQGPPKLTPAPPVLKTVPSIPSSVMTPMQIKTIATPPRIDSPVIMTEAPRGSPLAVSQPKKENLKDDNSTESGPSSLILNKLVELQQQIVEQQEQRLKLDHVRMEKEASFHKEMIELFKQIKDKLCEK